MDQHLEGKVELDQVAEMVEVEEVAPNQVLEEETLEDNLVLILAQEAQAAVAAAVDVYQEILEQDVVLEEQQHLVDLVDLDSQELFMYILELRPLL
jgi:hypothetical protein